MVARSSIILCALGISALLFLHANVVAQEISPGLTYAEMDFASRITEDSSNGFTDSDAMLDANYNPRKNGT